MILPWNLPQIPTDKRLITTLNLKNEEGFIIERKIYYYQIAERQETLRIGSSIKQIKA